MWRRSGGSCKLWATIKHLTFTFGIRYSDIIWHNNRNVIQYYTFHYHRQHAFIFFYKYLAVTSSRQSSKCSDPTSESLLSDHFFLSTLPFWPRFSMHLFWNHIPASLWVIENSCGGFPTMQLFMSSVRRSGTMFLRWKNIGTMELATLSHFQSGRLNTPS